MNKIYKHKRIWAIVMALTIVMSSNMLAAAAESSWKTAISNADMIDVMAEYDDSSFSVTESGDIATDKNSSVTPRDFQALTDVETYENLPSGHTIYGAFIRTVPSQTNITIIISCNVGCTVTVSGGGSSISKYIPGSGTYTICSAVGSPTYTIRFHSSVNAVAFQFFATDGIYN